MTSHPRLASSHRLVALFAAVTLIPSALLLVFGWRMLQQERVFQRAQLQPRREQTADLVVASLQQTIAEVERQLHNRESAVRLAKPGAVLVTLSPDAVTARPAGRVRYFPIVPRLPQPDARAAVALDDAEYRARNRRAAESLARQLAQSPDPATRALALVRLGRLRKQAGHEDDALRAYDEATAIAGVVLS